mgnify:CR=1 FL=1
MFRNREEAARRLAEGLQAYKGQRPLVLAIPRGAVPMAKLIAAALDGDFDVVLVRKLRAPWQPELAIGSIDESGWTEIRSERHEASEGDEYPFTIRVLDAGMTLRFSYGARGFRPLFDASQPDLTISARARDFIALLAREEDPDTLFFDRRLLMEGDTDLGLLVKNTLDGVELPRFDAARLSPQELLHRLRARLAAPHSA